MLFASSEISSMVSETLVNPRLLIDISPLTSHLSRLFLALSINTVDTIRSTITHTKSNKCNPIQPRDKHFYRISATPQWGSTSGNQSLSTIINGSQPVPARACSAAPIASCFFIPVNGAACSGDAPSETTSTNRSFETWPR